MRRVALAGLLPVLLVLSLKAQTSSLLTEAEFLSLLTDEHPAVAESAQVVALARARVLATATLENPVLGVIREDPDGPAQQIDWTLSWQLPHSARRLEIRARKKALQGAEARQSQDLLSLRLAMRAVYARWAIATARRDRLDGQTSRIQTLARREKERADHGEASGLEARRLSLAATGMEVQLALAEAAVEEARGVVRSWHPTVTPEALPVLPSLPPAGDLEEAHPRLREAQANLAAALLERQAAGRFLHTPGITLGWQRQEADSESLSGPVFGLTWSVPLFARNQGIQGLAEARVSAAQSRLETVRREIEGTRAGALASYRHLKTALSAAEAALLGNDKMLAGAEVAFLQGEANLTDLLDTIRSAAESELAVLDLREAALGAHREVERLTGHQEGPEALSRSIQEESSP